MNAHTAGYFFISEITSWLSKTYTQSMKEFSIDF